MLSKCCDECSLEFESDESNTETKLSRCFPARLYIRISKQFSCLTRKRCHSGSREDKRISGIGANI